MSKHADAGTAYGPIVLIVSPHAGNAGNANNDATAARLLAEAGITVGLTLPVSTLDHNAPQGMRWREEGYTAAVAAGGDGTVGAVATQLAGSGLPLGILPMGTSNDIARSLGVPLDLAAACAVIAHGVPTEVDTGQAVPAMTEPGALSMRSGDTLTASDATIHAALAARGAHFLHAVTLGLNVEFARLATDVARRERWGPFTYAASAIEALSRFEPVPVTLRLMGAVNASAPTSLDEHTVTFRAIQIAVVNLPVFGGGMNLRLPDAGPRDRLLDFIVIEALDAQQLRTTIEGLLAALTQLTSGARRAGETAEDGTARAEPADKANHFALPGVRRYQARAAVIETPEHVDVTLDGEVRSRTPVLLRVASEPLSVLLPAEAHHTLMGTPGADTSASGHQGED